MALHSHLLTLNAAVMAARGIEPGRGFAVMASEGREVKAWSRASAERVAAGGRPVAATGGAREGRSA